MRLSEKTFLRFLRLLFLSSAITTIYVIAKEGFFFALCFFSLVILFSAQIFLLWLLNLVVANRNKDASPQKAFILFLFLGAIVASGIFLIYTRQNIAIKWIIHGMS